MHHARLRAQDGRTQRGKRSCDHKISTFHSITFAVERNKRAALLLRWRQGP
jgi:hypothetical protein